MSDDIGLFEALYSQRAIRYFKPDPVPDKVIHKLIEAATKSPSGGNSQGWKFLIIRDQATKNVIADYYEQAWELAYGSGNPNPPSIQSHVRRSADHLARTMAQVPVLVIACIQHDGSPSTIGRGGSIFPAVQNFLLAARGLGLGSCLTSLHKRFENEIKELLDIPEKVETAALLPLGYPADNARYGPTRRAPVEDVTFREKWGEGW